MRISPFKKKCPLSQLHRECLPWPLIFVHLEYVVQIAQMLLLKEITYNHGIFYCNF